MPLRPLPERALRCGAFLVGLAGGCTSRSETIGAWVGPSGGGPGGDGGSGAESGAAGEANASGAAGEGGAAAEDPVRPTFGEPELVEGISVANFDDQNPTLSGDLLELLFLSNRTGSRELWGTRRASTDDPWEPPVIQSELNTPDASEVTPALSLDGLRVWFYSGRDPKGVWFSRRSSRSATWGPPEAVPLPGLGDASVLGAGLNESETLLAIDVLGASDAGWDLYLFPRASMDGWGEPTPLASLNTLSQEHGPFLYDGGLQILFTSDRNGSYDLYWARRASLSDEFGAPEPLTELNDEASSESDPHLSPDGRTLFFDSDRSGVARIYEARAASP